MLVKKAQSVEAPHLEQMEGEKKDDIANLERVVEFQESTIESEIEERLISEVIEGNVDGDENERGTFSSEILKVSNEKDDLTANGSTDVVFSNSIVSVPSDYIKYSKGDLRLRCLGSRTIFPSTPQILDVGDEESKETLDLNFSPTQRLVPTNDLITSADFHEFSNDFNITENSLQSSKDCKIGIAPKERQRLFEKFYRKARRLNKIKPMNHGRMDVQNRDFLSITRSALKRNISRMRGNKSWNNSHLVPHIPCNEGVENSAMVQIFTSADTNPLQPLELVQNVDLQTTQPIKCTPEQQQKLSVPSSNHQIQMSIPQKKPRHARWKPPSSWGVMYNRSGCGFQDNFSQRSESTLESQTKSSEVSEVSDFQIIYDDPALDFFLEDHHNYNLRTSEPPPTFTALRVYCQNLARLVLHCTEQTTTVELVKSITERLGISPTKKNKLFVSILGVERMMHDNERPFLLQKKLMVTFGYASIDLTNILASMDHGFHYFFMYGSKFDKTVTSPSYSLNPMELNSGNISLVNMNLNSIPLVLYKYTSKITSMQLCSNPNISNIPVNFARNLVFLTSISISRNRLAKFPSSVVLLRSLRELDLSQNLIGSISDVDFSKLKNLTSINLSSNNLKELSISLFKNCPNLEYANFSNNLISATPPSLFLNAKKLQHIDLSWNLITGQIPTDLQYASSLKYINFSHNSISGCFPESIVSLHGLVTLDMSENMLGGPEGVNCIYNIKKALSQLTNLQYLSLNHNLINTCPGYTKYTKKQRNSAEHEEFITLYVNNLKYLSLSHQELPFDTRGLLLIDACSTLTSLDLRCSGISLLPQTFFYSLLALEKLDLSGNKLNTLPRFTNPDTLRKNTKEKLDFHTLIPLKLKELYVSYNNLESLPNDIGSLSNLTVLELQGNGIRILPDDIWMCSSLRIINLTSNRLRKFTHSLYHNIRYSPGSICARHGQRPRPSNTGQGMYHYSNPSSPSDNTSSSRCRDLGSSLQYLYLSNNLLDNDILYLLFRLNNLVVLHCAINNISDITPWFTKNHDSDDNGIPWHSKLRELHLGSNSISVLPCEIEAMKSLKWLFLNGNMLKTIPGELGKLQKLEVLDLSSQHSSRYESTKLHYNVTNWPYEWNWNWNLDLKYLNLSGNKRLEIKEINRERTDQFYLGPARATGGGIVSAFLLNNRASNTPVIGRHTLASNISQVSSVVPSSKGRLQHDNRNLVNFNALINLRFLGLIDVTCHNPPPDETHRRRIRATNSEIPLESTSGTCVIKYAIADVLSRQMDPEIVRVGGMWLPQPPYSVDDHSGEADFEIWDLVIPRFRNRQDEALFAIFEGRRTSKGTRAAKFIYDNFSEIFASELENVGAQSRKLSGLAENNHTAAVNLPRKGSEPSTRVPNISPKARRYTKDSISYINNADKTDLFNSRGSAEIVTEYPSSETHGNEVHNMGQCSRKCSTDKMSAPKVRYSNIKNLSPNSHANETPPQDTPSNESERLDKTSKGNTRLNTTVNNSTLCNGAAKSSPDCNSFEKSEDKNHAMSSYNIRVALHRTFLRINRLIGIELGNSTYQDITSAESSDIHTKHPSSKRQMSKSTSSQNRKMSIPPITTAEQGLNTPDSDTLGTASQKPSGDSSNIKDTANVNNNIHNVMFGVSAVVLFFCPMSSEEKVPNRYRLFTANVGDSVAIVSRHGGRSEILSELHTIYPHLNNRKVGAFSTYDSSAEDHDPEDSSYSTTFPSSKFPSEGKPDWFKSEINRIRAAGGTLSDKCKIDGGLGVTRSFGYYPLLGIINSNPTITETTIVFDNYSLQELSVPASQRIDDHESCESLSNAFGTHKQRPKNDFSRGCGDEFIAISSSSFFKAFRRSGSNDIGARRLVLVARSAMIPQISSRKFFGKVFKEFGSSSSYSGSSYYNYVAKQLNSCYKDWSVSAMNVRDTAVGLAGSDNTRAGLVMILGLKDICASYTSHVRPPGLSPPLNSDNQLSQAFICSDVYEKSLDDGQTGKKSIFDPLSSKNSTSDTPESDICASVNTVPYSPMISPPQGQVALVFTDIKNSTMMWEDNPSQMRTAIKLHHAAIRSIILKTGGYEVKTDGDSFMVSFSSVTSAVEMCLKAQEEFLLLDWPNEIVYTGNNMGGIYYNDVTKNYYTGEFVDIFESAYCNMDKSAETKALFDEELLMRGLSVSDDTEEISSEYNSRRIGSVKFELLFRGLSVRMGVHWGSPLCEMDPVTFRMDYYGSMVNRAARVAGLAHGGQILLSSDSTKYIYGILGITDSDLPSVSGFHIPQSRKGPHSPAINTSFSPLLPLNDTVVSSSKETRRLAKLGLHHRCIGLYKLRGLETPELLFEIYHSLLKNRSAYFEKQAKGNLSIISRRSICTDTSNASDKPLESCNNNDTHSDALVSVYQKMLTFPSKDSAKESETPPSNEG